MVFIFYWKKVKSFHSMMYAFKEQSFELRRGRLEISWKEVTFDHAFSVWSMTNSKLSLAPRLSITGTEEKIIYITLPKNYSSMQVQLKS